MADQETHLALTQVQDRSRVWTQTLSSSHPWQNQKTLGAFLNDLLHEVARVDFIRRLPVEIIPLILESWDIQDIVRSASVSRSWHERIFQCPFLDLNVHLEQHASLALEKLIRWSDKIGKFYIIVPADESRGIWKTIATGCFTSLRSLHLFNLSEMCYDGFHEALAQLENTLEDLSMKCCLLDNFHFSLVLPKCGRKLKCLRYISATDVLRNTPVHIPELNLLNLTLYSGHISIASSNEIIQRCCRNAVEIHIGGCEPHAFSQIMSECPRIRYLSVNGDHRPVLEFGDSKKLSSDGGDGLRYLSVKDIPFDQIVSACKKHSRTIKSIALFYGSHAGVITGTADADHIFPPMECLSHLTISGYPREMDSRFAKLIVQSKYLTRLEFGCRDGGSPCVVQAAGTIARLGTLITSYHGDMAMIIPLYQTLADMGNRSALREVKIRFCRNVTPEVLAALGGIITLERITLSGAIANSSIINSFLRTVEGRSCLERVDVIHLNTMDGETLEIIKRISNLYKSRKTKVARNK